MVVVKKFVKKEYCNDVCCKWINLDLVLLIVSFLFDILCERLFVKVIFFKFVVCFCIWINFVFVWLFNEKIIVVELIKLYVLWRL